MTDIFTKQVKAEEKPYLSKKKTVVLGVTMIKLTFCEIFPINWALGLYLAAGQMPLIP